MVVDYFHLYSIFSLLYLQLDINQTLISVSFHFQIYQTYYILYSKMIIKMNKAIINVILIIIRLKVLEINCFYLSLILLNLRCCQVDQLIMMIDVFYYFIYSLYLMYSFWYEHYCWFHLCWCKYPYLTSF